MHRQSLFRASPSFSSFSSSSPRPHHSMTITNPLVLPELREALAPLLTTGDLARCARVCKDWHASFLPFLWKTIDLPSEHSKHPPLESLQRHKDTVQHLVFHGEVLNRYLSTGFPALRILHLFSARPNSFAMIRIHPSLIHLEIRGTNTKTPWNLPADLSNLTSLSLDSIVVRSPDQNMVWNLFSKLESLTLSNSWLSKPPVPMVANWRMKDLVLKFVNGSTLEEQLKWMEYCILLKRLTWIPSKSLTGNPVNELVQSIADNTWPELEELNVPNFRATDLQVSLIIGGMGRVRCLSINFSEPLGLVKTALRPHFSFLQRLEAMTTAGDNTSFILEILKSCPQLKSLRMGTVQVREILKDDAPWVCERSLKHLGVCFKVENHIAKPGQKVLLERLSRLCNLELLDLSSLTSLVQSLDLRLESGLEQLATLTRLEELTIVNTTQKMKKKDVEWMIQHWKNLKCIKGPLNGHDGVERQGMLARLGEAGIATRPW